MRLTIRTLLVLIVSLATPLASAQENAELPFTAKAGDKFKVEVTATDKKSRGGVLSTHVVRVAQYDGRVIEATAEGYVMSWTLKSLDHKVLKDETGAETKKAGIVGALIRAFSDVPVTFETDAGGKPVRVLEWNSVSKALAEALGTLLKTEFKKRLAASAPNKTPQEVEAVVDEQVDSMLNALILRHDERAAVIFLEEAMLTGQVQNLALPLRKPVEGSDVAPSLISETGVPHTGSVTLTRYDQGAGEAELTWESKFDSAALKEQTTGFVRQQMKAAKLDEVKIADGLKIFEKMEITRVDRGSALMAIENGWTKHLEYLKRVNASLRQGPMEESEKRIVIEVSRQQH